MSERRYSTPWDLETMQGEDEQRAYFARIRKEQTMSASEKPYSTNHFQAKPEPTLRERIADEVRNTFIETPGSEEAGWLAVAARVEAFAMEATAGGYNSGYAQLAWERTKEDILRAALPALSTPPPEEAR